MWGGGGGGGIGDGQGLCAHAQDITQKLRNRNLMFYKPTISLSSL